MSTRKGGTVKEEAETARVSPLAGTERAFFEGRRESLRAGYEAEVQGLVDAWEASAAAVASLRLKRFREIRLATFFGTVVLRCRQGVGGAGRWTCPALAHLGLRPNQRFSPDMERRMAVLAAETGSYEKAARAADAAAWFAASDGAVRSAVVRLGAAAAVPPDGPCAGTAGPEGRTRSSSWRTAGTPATGERTGDWTRRTANSPSASTGTRSARRWSSSSPPCW
ncbi:MAG TPA: hypothetical protein PLG22_16445, partial [Kiritimatiellia bacterium]|nr:hypothetical protein [Kiritimatiellia bacterium]